MSLNIAVLIGRLASDPDLSYTQTGIAHCTFTLAVDRPFTNQQGEREADFIRISTWRNLAENCANHLRKGSKAAVQGRIQTRTVESEKGKRTVVEVVAETVRFLDWKKVEGSENTLPKIDEQHEKPLDIAEDLPF